MNDGESWNTTLWALKQQNADGRMFSGYSSSEGHALENHLDHIRDTLFTKLEVIMKEVEEELKLFREKCKQAFWCKRMRLEINTTFSFANVPRWREREGDDSVHLYHDHCHFFLERHSNDASILTPRLGYDDWKRSQLLLVPIFSLQCFLRDKQPARHDMEEVIYVRAVSADYTLTKQSFPRKDMIHVLHRYWWKYYWIKRQWSFLS